MELSAADIERIPAENLRVPRDEFVAVRALAEELAHSEWYAVADLRLWLEPPVGFEPTTYALRVSRSP